MREATAVPSEQVPLPRLAVRGVLGGVLMGLANLVPGISGGTMLLAAGVYPAFVTGVAELTTLKIRPRSLVLLGSVGLAAGVSILLFAGLIRDLVLDHRWVMYSLFIGLTLGGVPLLKRMIGQPNRETMGGATFGFLVMAALALLQAAGGTGTGESAGVVMMFLAGIAAASAMILPGVSGSYLLLVLGVYVPILAGVDALKEGLRAADPGLLAEPVLTVVAPVGVGVVVGVAGVSNLLRWLLNRFEQSTLGVLMGLLLGAVVGLYPFQQAVQPAIGDIVKGRVVTPEVLAHLAPKDWPTVFVAPTAGQLVGALALIALGFLITLGVDWLGREPSGAPPQA